MGARGSARPGAVPPREEYLARWSRLHGGYDPRGSRWAGPWLALTYGVARPLAARRVPADALTAAGALTSLTVVGLAAVGGRWLLLAALVVVASGLLDNLDGAVAILTDRVTAWGYVLDSVVDRVSDGLYLLALWVAGAPAGLCVAAGALTLLQEYARARAAAGGMTEIGVVTVWERPTRVIVTTMALLGAGLHVGAAQLWVLAGAAAWLGLAVVGFGQLAVGVRRRLR